MKLLVNIDQKASVAAGYDAPHSTEVIDIPAANMPEDLRAEIAKVWDPSNGQVNADKFGYTRYSDIPSLVIGHPITEDRVINQLRVMIDARMARQAKLDADAAELAAIKQAKLDAVIAAAPLMIAELDSYIPGSFDTLDKAYCVAVALRRAHGFDENPSTYTTPELQAAEKRAEARRDAWKAEVAEAKKLAEIAEKAAKLEARKARIAGHDGSDLEVVEKTGNYNDKRYGKPWLAIVDPNTLKDFDFQPWVGDWRGGEHRFKAPMLTVLAQGQKDHRKGRGGTDYYGIVVPNDNGNVEWYGTVEGLRNALASAKEAAKKTA